MIGRGKSGILLPAGLLAVGLAVAAVMFLQTQEPVSAQTVPAATGKPPKPALVQQAQVKKDFSLPPLRSFDAILKRPIFSPNRRATQGSAVVVRQELGMTLTGIITSAGDKFVILAPQEGGESVRLREGEDYRGWTLTQVEQHKVVFRRGNKEEQLELIYDEPPPKAKSKKRRADRRITQQPSKQQTQRRTIRQNQNRSQKQNQNQNNEDDEEAEQEK